MVIWCLLQNQWERSVPSAQCTYGSSKELLQVLEQKPAPGQQDLVTSAVKTVTKLLYLTCTYLNLKKILWLDTKKLLTMTSFFLLAQPEIHSSNKLNF